MGAKIAIASGKGGTGKTTVATCLAHVASQQSQTVAYLDCDVEEPNGHIFLDPQLQAPVPAGVLVPKVDEGICTFCGKCGEFCQYKAIMPLADAVLVFAELCHGCGGCAMVCPEGAITEVLHQTGTVEAGASGPIAFVRGTLDVGQVMAPPVIKAVKLSAPPADITFIDAPPGTSCPVIESVRDCDFVLLVTEPTPFGLNDLKLAVDLVRILQLPFGVVINRADIGDDRTELYCRQEQITVLGRIPDDRRIAEAYSRGELVSLAVPACEQLFKQIFDAIIQHVEVCL